ncbi:MAG TPA: hypothetical protein VLA93_11340 [Pyrinomonadaceae bacterium]|nr:hypothetical protein [Pyrinomonadaceae bacterium]
MLKRTIAISLLLLLSVGMILPFADSNAHGVRQSYQVGVRKHHRYRSRAWWRRYRARLRKKRAAAMELAHRNSLLSLPANLNLGNFIAVTPQPAQVVTKVVNSAAPATVTTKTTAATRATLPAPAPVAAPSTVAVRANVPVAPTVTVPMAATPIVSASTVNATKINMTRSHAASPTATVVTSMNSTPVLVNTPVVVNTPAAAAPKAVVEARPLNETRLRPKNPVSPLPGELSISVVALSRPNPAFLTAREEAKLLAGVNTSDLRRIVIDRMIAAGGWVTNDYVREINGGRVFVVTARTPRNGQTAEKAWTFYFTESGGRIYSLTTDSPLEHTDRMGREAERFLGTLRSTPSQDEK